MTQAVTPRSESAHDFDPCSSVVWKVNCEVVVLLGWTPAVLMQIAHPLVAAGVAEHSQFLADPKGRPRRLRRTIDAMLALTFGTPDEVREAARGINAIHDRVNGRLADGAGVWGEGAAYSAHDPALLCWVHATMLDTLPRTYERYVGPLSPLEKDRYCAEGTGIEPLLGIPAGYLPRDTRALHHFVERTLASGQIAPSATSRLLACEILNPAMPSVARPLAWLANLQTLGLLPPAFRELYGFSWDARREAAFRASAALTRALLRPLPSRLRHWRAARRARERAARGARC